jgi:DNA (cytosine-5)-methyltransferase 1
LEECGRKVQIERNKFTQSIETNGIDGIATNTSNIGYECRTKGKSTERKSQSNDEQPERFNELHRTNFQMFPSQPPICGGNDGLPTQLDGITFSKWRKESLKGYGNAVVPQVAYEIFKVIEQLHYDTIS